MTANAEHPREEHTPLRSADELRHHAEELIVGLADSRAYPASTMDAAATLHELRVHQIELEMQNSQLRSAQLALDEQRAKYYDLFDLAPVGYLTIGSEGVVTDANLTAIHLLGVERQMLVGRPFSAFVFGADRDVYYKHLGHLKQSDDRQIAELRLQPLDAEPFWVRVAGKPQRNTSGGPVYYGLAFDDISERLEATEALRESEQRYRSLFEDNHAAILLVDPQTGAIADANPSACAWYGWSREEMLAMNISQINTLSSAEISAEMELANTKKQRVFNFRHRRADGTVRDVEVYSGPIEVQGRSLLYSFVQDTTERKQAEAQVRASDERLLQLVESANDFMWEVDQSGTYTFVSSQVTGILGYEPAEMIGKTPFDFMPAEEAALKALQFGGIIAERQPFRELQNVNRSKDGRLVILETNGVPFFDDVGALGGYRGTDRDITQRLEAEATVHESEQLLRESQRVARVGHYVFDFRTGLWTSSAVLDEIYGIDDSFVRNVENWLQIIHPDDREAMLASFQAEASGKESAFDTDHRIIRVADGAELVIHGLGGTEFDDKGDPVRMFGVIQDVTESRLSERALLESEERYRLLAETSPDLIYVIDSEDRVVYVNSAAARSLHATVDEIIGRPRKDLFEPRSSAQMAQALAHVFESGATLSHESQATYPGGEMWMKTTLVPMKDDSGRVTTVFGVSRDLTEHKRAEDAVVRSSTRLEGVLRSVVETMGKVVEARDPYTLGHEQGVAAISKLIAEEMGIPEGEVDGIVVAALVHDVGKLTVPAEILTKPGRLSEVEFQLIKGHSQAGYEILKDIDFDWPVAEMVLQHHERMDGSGYPGGLSGGDISVAARILMVADVIEAMAEHRPYRPALGLDAAMAEITSHPDKFDSQVVSACVRLYEAGRIELTQS